MSAPRAAFREMVRYETRLALRIPRGLFAGVLVPTMLLVLFGSIPSTNKRLPVLGGLTYFDVYVPVFLAMVIAAIGLIGLPVPLASYREKGVLRRLSVTPAPPAWVLAAQLILNLRFVAVELVLLLIVATAGFGLAAPESPGGLALALVLAIAALFAIGLWISAIASTEQTAAGLAVVCFFPMMYFAGLFYPRAEMARVLVSIGNFTPLGATVQAIQSALQDGFPPVEPLLVLPAYAFVFAALAVRFFRWE